MPAEAPQFPKPFTVEEIQNHTKAVVIAFLLGVVLLQWGFNRYDKEQDKSEARVVRQRKDSVLRSELALYRALYFDCKSKQERADSIAREKYENLVNKANKR